jgi:hypothetical protein
MNGHRVLVCLVLLGLAVAAGGAQEIPILPLQLAETGIHDATLVKVDPSEYTLTTSGSDPYVLTVPSFRPIVTSACG